VTHQIDTEIEIDAPAESVWRVLTDFASYPDWNPFIPYIAGSPRKGEKLEVRIRPLNGREMTFRPTILAADRERELRWRGKLLLPGLLDGEHTFALMPLPDGGARFAHRERFSGLLVPLVRRSLDRGIRGGFEAMNQALKIRAETLGVI
jgi:hypothetical protein